MKYITFLIAGFIIGTLVSVSFAKYEASNNDAKPIVGYGKTSSGSIVAILVGSDGSLQ